MLTASFPKWKQHSKALKSINDRLKYGVRKELLPLVELPGIGRVRARLLHRHGFKTVADVSGASVAQLSQSPGFGTGIVEQLRKHFGNGEEVMESPVEEKLKENIPEASPASLDDFF